jgi:hypothetical protein
MDDKIKEEIQRDIELAKSMTNITSSEAVMELTNRLIGYLDIVNEAVANYEYKTSQLKGKQKILIEYVRTAKQFATSLSINNYHSEQHR